MSNKHFIDLYELKKDGLHNTLRKQCLCGEEMDMNVKECPKCKTSLSKNNLLNINKNTYLARRIDVSLVGNVCSFKVFHLLSNGFELYESETLNFSINKDTNAVEISNNKIFKTWEGKEELIKFLNDYLPGFYSFVMRSLSEFQFEYATSNFTSLSNSQISNFLNVYLNYRALIPYLRGYKVFYYGNKVNLKKYFPSLDFNNPTEIDKLGFCPKLLLTWDIKNEKYIESIIDISKKATDEEKNILEAIVDNMLLATQRGRYSLDYNDVIDSFSLLYNKEISLSDFVRIYNNSRENYFNQIFKFRKNYKKTVDKTLDWSTIDKIDRKTIGVLDTKVALKSDGFSKKDIDEAYDKLDANPVEALKILCQSSKKIKEKD